MAWDGPSRPPISPPLAPKIHSLHTLAFNSVLIHQLAPPLVSTKKCQLHPCPRPNNIAQVLCAVCARHSSCAKKKPTHNNLLEGPCEVSSFATWQVESISGECSPCYRRLVPQCLDTMSSRVVYMILEECNPCTSPKRAKWNAQLTLRSMKHLRHNSRGDLASGHSEECYWNGNRPMSASPPPFPKKEPSLIWMPPWRRVAQCARLKQCG